MPIVFFLCFPILVVSMIIAMGNKKNISMLGNLAADALSVLFVSASAAVILSGLSFLLCIASEAFSAHAFMILLFPIAGIATYFLYLFLKVPYTIEDSDVISRASNINKQELTSSNNRTVSAGGFTYPIRIIAGIAIGTFLTIAFGGSVGAESAAFQIGSALSCTGVVCLVYRALSARSANTAFLARCGMTSALSALFGTPIASALFIWEMSHSANAKIYDFIGLVFSGVVGYAAYRLSHGESLIWHPMGMHLPSMSCNDIGLLFATIFICFAGALLWYMLLTYGKIGIAKLSKRLDVDTRTIKTIVAAGAIYCIVFICLFPIIGTMATGTGNDLISTTMHGSLTGTEQQMLAIVFAKMLMTAVLLCSLFKGGDLTPTIAIGATIGAVSCAKFGMPVELGAMIGISVFLTVCTNCKCAAVAFCMEAYGIAGLVSALPVAIAYFFTSQISFYDNNKSTSCLARMYKMIRGVVKSR